MALDGMAKAELDRLRLDAARQANWKRWGPYLAERQWGTVREDYSADGSSWTYFSHDMARRQAYRWGEDGLLGITDRECRICFAPALWNGRDPIVKERLFGLTGPEGNHGEDVKEEYYYLDSTPTHSYLKALYKYPQAAFPYDQLVQENHRRGRHEPEYELRDTGVFAGNRYFDIFVEYAKYLPDDLLIRITAINRGPDAAMLHLLPTVWARNSWTWGCKHEGCEVKPHFCRAGKYSVAIDHATLGRLRFDAMPLGNADWPRLLFTENETTVTPDNGAAVNADTKDAFHRYLVQGDTAAINPAQVGSKAAAYYLLEIPPGGQHVIHCRLTALDQAADDPFGPAFDHIFAQRIAEADAFYDTHLSHDLDPEKRRVARQGFAGLLWSKQCYQYIVRDWLEGDPGQPPPPPPRLTGRNHDWTHLYSRDVLSMPDKWEYPWFAAWDTAFHMICFAHVDPQFAKDQLILMLREWYMHPNGQLPAYEFAFGDANPPVHAWACWRVYKMTAPPGQRDVLFLRRAFHKLLINFTWWVNRKDIAGKNVFGGGFLGLDNIGVFDRSQPLPTGGFLEQADGTAWMAFYCATMLSIALELSQHDPAYEDIASKFFEHFVAIVDAINTLGGNGLWDQQDGFYYDQIRHEGRTTPLRCRSLVGAMPLIAVEVLEGAAIEHLAGFRKRMDWFLKNRQDLARHITYMESRHKHNGNADMHYLLAIPSKERLQSVLRCLLDENEFWSPHGLRSLSRIYHDKPYVYHADGTDYQVRYTPGESDTGQFGGNSNWRGPVWFPLNFLLLEALERYHHFYGDELTVECPTGSGHMLTLQKVADELGNRLMSLFLPDANGQRPCHGEDLRYRDDPHYRELLLFHEYFDGDTGRGCGASHQTGWTALAARLIAGRCRQGKV